MTNDDRDHLLTRTATLVEVLSARMTEVTAEVKAVAATVQAMVASQRGVDSWRGSAWAQFFQWAGLIVAIGLGLAGLLLG